MCTVVGFINATFSGVEQGPGHSVPVGYQKGAAIARQNLVFTVENTPGTASEFARIGGYIYSLVIELIYYQLTCRSGFPI